MDITMEIAKSLVSQGPLVGLLFWLHVQNNTKIEAKDAIIESLNKELRDFMEKHLNKSSEAIVNSTTAINTLVGTLKNA